ncbi:MAG: spore coat U domain-containing protein [Burkholderiaceae bacterium]|nr:spore coat U domain-containing protein [Burkholderiaceae bacterium]
MRALIFGLVAAAAASPASAQSGVSCTAATSSGLFAFGNVVPMSPVGVSTLLGEFIIRCANVDNQSRNVRLRLAISAGNSGTAAQRQMRRAGAPVPLLYNLYEDAAYTVVWTAATGGRPDEFLTIPARSTTELRRSIFGRIPGSQTGVTVGLYSDTLLATVRY